LRYLGVFQSSILKLDFATLYCILEFAEFKKR
jgi:hypothetical protein